MAAGKEQAGWKIAVIILTVLTIVLGITTYIFYDKHRTEVEQKVAALKERDTANQEREEIKVDAGRLKEMTANGPKDSVKQIMETFVKHQNTYGGTLPDDSTKDYPTMLESYADQNRELQEQIVSYQQDIANLEQQNAQGVEELKDKIAILQEKFDSQAEDIRAINDNAEVTRKNYETNMEDAATKVAEKNDQILQQKQESSNKENDLREGSRKQASQIDDLKRELRPHRNWENEAPDGEIVRINQKSGTVFINLGTADGLRRQTSFSVLPHDARNALNVDPKGSLEVIRIVGPHLAEARITSDALSDPILPGDRIVSPVFRAGHPEQFAVAGAIDFNGDGTSDLPQLLALIKRNGGVVDTYSDKDGRLKGAMSSSTKFLIMGERPDEKSPEQVREAYRRLLDGADRYGVGRMPLADFLDYVGYRGRTGAARRPVVSSKTRGAQTPFRRRPPTGNAKKSAFD
jgi:hypothetical protein